MLLAPTLFFFLSPLPVERGSSISRAFGLWSNLARLPTFYFSSAGWNTGFRNSASPANCQLVELLFLGCVLISIPPLPPLLSRRFRGVVPPSTCAGRAFRNCYGNRTAGARLDAPTPNNLVSATTNPINGSPTKARFLC